MTVIFLHQCVGCTVEILVLAARGQQADRVVAARRGPVFVHAAAFIRHQLTRGATLDRLQLDPGHAVPAEFEGLGVLPQELGRADAEPLFQTDDVIRCEHDIDVLAAGIEAVDALVATKLDDGITGQLGGHHRAARNRGIIGQFGFVRHLAHLSNRGQNTFSCFRP